MPLFSYTYVLVLYAPIRKHRFAVNPCRRYFSTNTAARYCNLQWYQHHQGLLPATYTNTQMALGEIYVKKWPATCSGARES